MPSSIEDEVFYSARKAVEFDNNNQPGAAICYYKIAIYCLKKLPSSQSFNLKIIEYENRITELHKEKHETSNIQHESNVQNCKFLLTEAFSADDACHYNVAVKLYTDAAEVGLNAMNSNIEEKTKLSNLVRRALDRAEILRGIKKVNNIDNEVFTTLAKLPPLPETDLFDEELPTHKGESNPKSPVKPPLHRGDSAHLRVAGGNSNYTEEEKRVLLHSSHINDHEFVPFMNVDLAEKFQYAIPFTDKDGLLELAPKQKIDFHTWCRPDELFPEPKMVMAHHVDYYSIKQTVISDCSFVASLAVSAQYEKRFGRRLITSIIYPKNKNKEPVYNPCGKYMVKLHINGITRKVIIDDLLPVSRHNQLLCSYSSNRGELWISLLEKAYMKVMGGYDFPGSNSNIDLHALTGWIPERGAIRPNDADFNKDSLFDMLLSRLHKGDVLVTVATGELSDIDTERTGLVPTHAYAVLDVRKINGVKLLLLKNPWSHLRWRGNYSELDSLHWTPELREILNYDPDSASQYDNGIFWIDYDSICKFFDVFYMNWNPGLFTYTYCIHQMWNAGLGPVKDAYNIGDNPQFVLDVQENVSGAIWILLTRHITDIADFRQNQEYITVLVYRNDGKRVYYPHDPPPYIDGVRINSPHYLCKIRLGQNSESRYTLVISQYEKTTTIYYTLRAYGTCPFTLKKISQPYKYEKEITDGQWKSATAGGCCNHPTYPDNPHFELTLESSNNNNNVLIILKGPKIYQIGFDINAITLNDPDASTGFKSKSSGPYRSGFVYLELESVPSGTYNIIPSTYLPGQEGPFFLICKASCNLQLTRL